jgi:hypothetical protein
MDESNIRPCLLETQSDREQFVNLLYTRREDFLHAVRARTVTLESFDSDIVVDSVLLWISQKVLDGTFWYPLWSGGETSLEELVVRLSPTGLIRPFVQKGIKEALLAEMHSLISLEVAGRKELPALFFTEMGVVLLAIIVAGLRLKTGNSLKEDVIHIYTVYGNARRAALFAIHVEAEVIKPEATRNYNRKLALAKLRQNF